MSKSNYIYTKYILDIEADNLYDEVTTIWCYVIKNINTGEYQEVDYNNRSLKSYLSELLTNKTNIIIGHNIVAYDLRIVDKLFGIKTAAKKFDTLVMSSLLYPDRKGGHSLESWGTRFKYPKLEWTDFSSYQPGMLEYCRRDVDLTELVYNRLCWEMQQ